MAEKRFSVGFYISVAALGFIAALCLWGVFLAFQAGGAPIGLHGWVAMAIAVVFSGACAGGLMWLAFYSSKKGVDDDANRFN
jgi:hypothetical protein